MRKIYMKLPILVPVVLGLGMAAVSAQSRPTYEALKVSRPIVVDGKLSDPAWASASPAGFADNTTGKASPLQSQAKVLYDDQYVYFAFEFYDANIWSTMKNRDEHLWTEEVAEVFIQANPSNPNYIELEVNPLGTMLDIYLIDIRKPLPYTSWNPADLKWAVEVDGTVDKKPGDRKWTCEMAMPIADVVTAPNLPPKPGDRWRLNMYRVEQLPEEAGLAWSPTMKRDFHVPAMFGDLVFTGRLVP